MARNAGKPSQLMKNLLILLPFLFSCAARAQDLAYERLLEYEGKYEYIGSSTLELMASEMDSTLYAVIDGAKYPLTFLATDTFANVQDIPVLFQREEGQVKSYQVEGQQFNLITTDIEKAVAYPRKELFHSPERYVYKKPEAQNDGLLTGTIHSAFNNPEPLIGMVKETIKGSYPEVHSILIYKDGQLVLEEYFYGYADSTPHQLRSATKPFIGALVGVAIDQKKIGSEKDALLPYFSREYNAIAHQDKLKEQISIEDFLTYRHGMDCENDNPESEGSEQNMMESTDWVKHTLDLPMVQEPGKKSSYCTGCPLTLGRVVEIATERALEDYAKENLFAPDQSSLTTFSQLYLTPRDLVKLAKMYLDGGSWEGRQILPEEWVVKTFSKDGT